MTHPENPTVVLLNVAAGKIPLLVNDGKKPAVPFSSSIEATFVVKPAPVI